MPDRKITSHLDNMRRDWDRRARENARYFVATGKEDWSEKEFYESGRTNFQQYVLSDLENICQDKDPREMTALEIGCGAGRITRALAEYFGQVYAVDISREMVRRARRALRGHPNAHVVRNNGKDLTALRPRWWERGSRSRLPLFDFAFSYIVFQHIPSRAIIENYVREVNRMLRPGALFKFQVQGYESEEILTEGTWVGVPFTETEAREMAGRCGFEMRYHFGAGTQYFMLWFFKTRELT